MSSEQIAWLAGIWDGEGSIGAFMSKNGAQATNPVLRLLAQVSMTDEPTVRVIKAIVSEIAGREVRYRVATNSKGFRPAYHLRLYSHADLKAVLSVLVPHLVTKRRQAELVLRLAEIAPGRGGNHRSPWTDEHHKILRELGDLNRRYSPQEWSARLQ